MQKIGSAMLAALFLVALSSAAWAHGKTPRGFHAPAKHHQHYFKINRERAHQMIVRQELRNLKKFFNKADPDAQQLFLTYLGTAVSSNEDQVQTVRTEYDQQIADLNGQISALQQQLQDKTDQLNAANTANTKCDTSLTQCQTTTQEQSDELNTDQTTIASLTTQLQTCTQSLADASGGTSSTQGSQPPQAIGSISTGMVIPYAVAVDHSGNMVVLDQNALTVAEFDPSGTRRPTSPSILRAISMFWISMPPVLCKNSVRMERPWPSMQVQAKLFSPSDFISAAMTRSM
jgi:hypothetical protein